jgi:lipopolysaccharide/colanic/teichoic acid biosynthesis glycosyltransferase
VKPVLDRAAALLLLVLLSPCLAVLALLVRSKLGSPVLFRQARPGLHGVPFLMFKFRTMTDERDADGRLLPDVRRLTPFGRMLRSTSLDELPQFWNVLCGEMSLIGPRPLMSEHLELADAFQERRREVKPGITGWAQVNGRNELDWETKFAHDAWYVDNLSWRLDLTILLRTLAVVVRREGILHAQPTPIVHFMPGAVERDVVHASTAAVESASSPKKVRPRNRAAA